MVGLEKSSSGVFQIKGLIFGQRKKVQDGAESGRGKVAGRARTDDGAGGGGGGEDGLGGGWLLVEIRGAVDMKGPVLRLKSAAMVRERMREILLEEQI